MISQASIHPGTKRASERGQISIFFASSLIVLISIIAFVINIGLFVKAKINLQNAVDAGAYAGAAVQARMLNRIGYMNWDMRNVYKEWMFKYYVLGNLNINNVENPSTISTNVDFTMLKDPNAQTQAEDIYNFPSVCIHYAGVPTNVCKRYALPGIPRFEPTSLVGIDETTSSFIDAIVKEKSSDCSKRTQLNFNVTNMWAYNYLTDDAAKNAFSDAPQIAPDRPGAWPKAVELAIRTRSLEYAMNRAPIRQGVCSPGGGEPGCVSPDDLAAEQNYGNERPVKAFWSAYRNLGNEYDNEMKRTFTLTELPPKQVSFPGLYSLSTQLMSEKAKNNGKYYLDLKLMMVNYATFFTALIARNDAYTVNGQLVKSEGACDVSKIAIPVPGYPLGFYKNPDLLTYYAVKGTAQFQGLFNPFSGIVKLTAWAAAKPMGGRIGPALFTQSTSDSRIQSRTTADKKRSLPYLSGLDLTNAVVKGGGTYVSGKYFPGMPIPINPNNNVSSRFWVTDETDEVGGWIDGDNVVFGIPNMVYDFDNNSPDPANYTVGGVNTTIIKPTGSKDFSSFASGLYKGNQFTKFRQNLVGTNTVDEISQSITQVKAPTHYEAANYTIPIPYDQSVGVEVDGGFMDTFGFATGAPDDAQCKSDNGCRQVRIYAPLYSTGGDAMYSDSTEIASTILNFIKTNEGAMRKYRNSMNRVAQSIYQADPSKYIQAAERISNYDFAQLPDATSPKDCKSITGNFLYFYFGSESQLTQGMAALGCPKPLAQGVQEYFGSGKVDPIYHRIDYVYKEGAMPGLDNFKQLLTGYMPGPLRGASNAGLFTTPFSGGDSETMRRTGYSTKLITLNSITGSNNPSYTQASSNFAIYSEGKNTALTEDVTQKNFLNALDTTSVNLPSNVTY